MAILEQPGTGRCVSLSTRHMIGRAASCPLRLDDPAVSAIHAVLEWRHPQGWWLRDVGSRNGTFLNGRRVPSNNATPLIEGAELRFGGSAELWRLTDAGPPRAAAKSAMGVLCVAERDLLVLPRAEVPELSVFRVDAGWHLELVQGCEEPQLVRDGMRVKAGGVEWTLLLPDLVPDTKQLGQNSAIGNLALVFLVSRDEEHVEVQVDGSGLSCRLDHRSYNYMLLTLARARLADEGDTTLHVSDHGWVDQQELERMLRIGAEQLNLWVFRARKRFSELGVVCAPGIVERRSGSRQLRIGTGQLRVERA